MIACSAAATAGLTSASAAECNGKSDALGVDRVIAVDPSEHPRIGTMQYEETLPLADHEVVLTFDDGPSPRYTDRILEALATECVKATFFMVGEMAKLFPAEAKKVEAEGHTIGTHSFHHPFTFNRMTQNKAGQEIDAGIDAVGAALGSSTELAPFFRVPGFLTSKSTEAAIASRGLMTWSADVPSDDWRGIGSAEIVRRTMSRLEAKGRGILLFHDIHEHTVEALPEILKELKLKGYKVAQIVPANATVAKTETTPEQWRLPPAQAVAAGEDAPSADASSSERGCPKRRSAMRRKGLTRMAAARRARKALAACRGRTCRESSRPRSWLPGAQPERSATGSLCTFTSQGDLSSAVRATIDSTPRRSPSASPSTNAQGQQKGLQTPDVRE